MANLYKAEIYILDTNDNYSNLQEIINAIENSIDINIACFNDEAVSLEWDDNIDINYRDCTIEDYRKYFE